MDDATITTLSDGAEAGFNDPSGIAVRGDVIYVTDNGNIVVLNRADGSLIDWLELDVPADSLMGLDFDAAGSLYVVNYREDQILRISPRTGS